MCENFSQSISSPDFLTRQAVADATMVAIGQLVHDYLQVYRISYGLTAADAESDPRYAKLLAQNPCKTTRLATRNMCEEGSMKALHCLAAGYAHLFSDLYLVAGKGTQKKPLINYDNKHVVYVARGNNGVYYSGSPANCELANDHDQSLRISEASSLDKIMKEIIALEGGDWPPVDFIISQDRSYWIKPLSAQTQTQTVYFTKFKLDTRGCPTKIRMVSHV